MNRTREEWYAEGAPNNLLGIILISYGITTIFLYCLIMIAMWKLIPTNGVYKIMFYLGEGCLCYTLEIGNLDPMDAYLFFFVIESLIVFDLHLSYQFSRLRRIGDMHWFISYRLFLSRRCSILYTSKH
jgi:hypothetical protein